MFKYKAILIMLLMVSLISFFVTFAVTTIVLHPSSPETVNLELVNVAVQDNQKPKVKVQRLYNICGHFQEIDYDFSEFNVINEEDLRGLFKEDDGWTINFVDGQWIVTQTVNNLCPEEREKRHLRIIDDFIAVYQGTPHYKGDLLYITEISIWNIPDYWREKILFGETYFNNEKDLLQALDTLDEFR